MKKPGAFTAMALAVSIAAAPVAAAPSAPQAPPATSSSARAGAGLQSASQFGSLQDILLLLGAIGSALVAGVEFWWGKDDPTSP